MQIFFFSIQSFYISLCLLFWNSSSGLRSSSCALSILLVTAHYFAELCNFVSWEWNQPGGKLLWMVLTWWHEHNPHRCASWKAFCPGIDLWVCVSDRVLKSAWKREREMEWEKNQEWEVSGGWNMYELLRQICIKHDWSAERSWDTLKEERGSRKRGQNKKEKHEEKIKKF